MTEVTIVVRESGKLKPDFSLRFSLPEVPREGDYISIFRPDAKVHTEDVIVRKVWWHLHHEETRGAASEDDVIVGGVRDILVECDPAIGPYARDNWRQWAEAAASRGGKVEHFDVVRFSISERQLKGMGDG